MIIIIFIENTLEKQWHTGGSNVTWLFDVGVTWTGMLDGKANARYQL